MSSLTNTYDKKNLVLRDVSSTFDPYHQILFGPVVLKNS
jgi:hypothetical protein